MHRSGPRVWVYAMVGALCCLLGKDPLPLSALEFSQSHGFIDLFTSISNIYAGWPSF